MIPSLSGYDCDMLPIRFVLGIRRAACRVEIIKWNSKWDMRYELFNRLNTGGTPLSGQEIRNCIFRSGLKNFYEFIDEATADADFINITQIKGDKKKKLFDQELVVRFVALVKDWRTMDAPISLYATTYMRNMLNSQSDIDEETKKKFFETIKLLSSLGPDVFRQGKTFSPSLYDAITVSLANTLDKYRNDSRSLLSAIETLKRDGTFAKLRMSAGSTRRTRSQIERAMELFE